MAGRNNPMDMRIQALVDEVKVKLGLEGYDLRRHSLTREVTLFRETEYTLGMEWFPKHVTQEEEDGFNPEGACVVEVDIASRKIKSVVFVQGKTFAKRGICFANLHRNDIIKWLEQETGLTYGKQLRLQKEEEGRLYFEKCINGIPLYPSGYIELQFDRRGNLTFFVDHGQLPPKEMTKQEAYTLTLEQLDSLAAQQLKLLEYPDDKQQKMLKLYAIEEIFVTNDQSLTIPFEVFGAERSYVKIDERMEWEEPLHTPFARQETPWNEEVTVEQAFAREPSPDSFPITTEEQARCVSEVRNFLRTQYPNNAGKWTLQTLHRDQGYIHATLRLLEPDHRIFQRKLTVILDAKHYRALNHIDNEPMLEIFASFAPADQSVISSDQAFDKIKPMLELKPYYVYDADAKQFVLCGKLDCHYAVMAASGEVVALADL